MSKRRYPTKLPMNRFGNESYNSVEHFIQRKDGFGSSGRCNLGE